MNIKVIRELLDFEPQLTEVEYGKEASLKVILFKYYYEHGVPYEEVMLVVEQYIKALSEGLNDD